MRLKSLCSCGSVAGICRCRQAKRLEKPKDYKYPPGWTKLARVYRQEHPLCEHCLTQGRTTPATEVHHIERVVDRLDLALVRDNLVSVCRGCHEELESAGYVN